MKLLVFSDSHRSTEWMAAVLKMVNHDVQMVLHLGDCVDDIKRLRLKYTDLPFITVNGNCDPSSYGEPERIISVQGKKILLLHGHRQNVKFSYDRLVYTAAEKEVDACLFGHTHQSVVFRNGPILFMNPGSIGEPRGGTHESYGILSISQYGVIDGQIVGRIEGGPDLPGHSSLWRPLTK